MATPQQPTDHTRVLPLSVIQRCADTSSTHGLSTGGNRRTGTFREQVISGAGTGDLSGRNAKAA